MNSLRLRGMNQRCELLNTLKKELNNALQKKLEDPVVYKKLLKNLIIQSLIKMMEPEVSLRCLKKDEGLIKEVIEDAALEFSNLCKEEIGNEFFTKININTENYLEDSKLIIMLI